MVWPLPSLDNPSHPIRKIKTDTALSINIHILMYLVGSWRELEELEVEGHRHRHSDTPDTPDSLTNLLTLT